MLPNGALCSLYSPPPVLMVDQLDEKKEVAPRIDLNQGILDYVNKRLRGEHQAKEFDVEIERMRKENERQYGKVFESKALKKIRLEQEREARAREDKQIKEREAVV